MAKLKRNFLRGRMNKDLDERLVPNGEYRDAVNIQISTSEGSDVGAIENILGNTKKNNKPSGGSWDPAFGLNSTKCIGVVRDGQNNKIYWFITGQDGNTNIVNAILEYDQAFDTVEPVLVDTSNVLGFDPEYLITGVNILEGLLYWTDNLNEPKVINIATFKAGSDQGASSILSVHTQVYGRNFIEKDVTVITEVPPTPLFAIADPSLIGGAGTGITPITTNDSPGLAFQNVSAGDIRQVNWSASGSPVSWPAGSRAVFTTEIEQEDGSIDKYQVVGEFVNALSNATLGDLTVESATPNIPSTPLSWSMLLIEDDPIFKNDFPRFSYRYKFTDGRYSTYAPFSNACFVPGEFKYLSRDGNNEGMNSVIRKITLTGFPTMPANAEEIEILYKGATSNNIYVVETLNTQQTSFEITNGLLGPVIESVQMLRLFDNVPRLAKAQEVVANRVVYGNYLQNYDVEASAVKPEASAVNLPHTNTGFGIQSIKTDREYQLGVSFVDDYGRESPVFTSRDGSVSFNIENAKDVNKIQAFIPTGSVPTWAEYFKYYIKNNTPEYYNLALDRYYKAEDDSVWLSFPSSERNKVQEGQYIILKKAHDSSTPVLTNNKYKILDISNEAPDYIALAKIAKGRVECLNYLQSGEPGFREGSNKIRFLAPTKNKNEGFFESFSSKGYVEFMNEAGNVKTAKYKIQTGGPNGAIVSDPIGTGEDFAIFEATLLEGLRSEDFWLYNLNDLQKLKCIVYQEENFPLPEFQGRFFVKISGNATFYDNAEKALSPATLPLVEDYLFEAFNYETSPWSSNVVKGVWYQQYSTGINNPTLSWKVPASGDDFFKIGLLFTDFAGFKNDYNWVKYNSLAPGVKFKFKYADGTSSAELYTIAATDHYENANNDPYFVANVGGNLGRQVTITMDRVFDDTQYGGNPTTAQITGLLVYREQEIGDQNLLSSTNPAIFETEPDELVDLDIYWEVSGLIPRSEAGNRTPYYLNWYNCYSFGNGVESDRIRDDFNAPIMGKGVRVNAELQEPYREERRASGLIYGGLYNSLSSVNNTNQFIAGVKITKDLDPQYGGIQKLHTRDTNLVAFAEDKVFRILADKDALYNADGNTNLTSTNRVLGDASTFAGEFGISKNPESFATYGFRAYFTDKSRGAVLRLSMDGITEISSKGMSDYFIDKFRTVSTPLIGSFDEDTSSYNLAVGNESVSFKEQVDGWPTRLSYVPEFATSLNNEYYTFNDGELYEHSNTTRNNFYGIQGESSVELIFNDAPSSIKNFKTLAYEGSERWTATVSTDKQSGEVNNWRDNEGLYFNFIKGAEATWDNATQTGTLNSKEFSVQGIGEITVANGGAPYEFLIGGNVNASLSVGDTLFIKRPAGIFKVGDVVSATNNRITVNDVNNVVSVGGEYAFFAKSNEINISGLLGYYGSVTLTNADTNKSELFGVSSEVFISSE